MHGAQNRKAGDPEALYRKYAFDLATSVANIQEHKPQTVQESVKKESMSLIFFSNPTIRREDHRPLTRTRARPLTHVSFDPRVRVR